MIDRVLVKFGRRPRKHEHVMAAAGRDFGSGDGVDAFHRDVVHHDFGVVLTAPCLGKRAGEPLVILGQEMRPFGDLQRLLTGQRPIGERHERPGRRGGGRQPDDIAPGGLCCSDLGHSDKPPVPGFGPGIVVGIHVFLAAP